MRDALEESQRRIRRTQRPPAQTCARLGCDITGHGGREVRLAVVRDGCKRNRLISELALRNTLSHRASPMRVSRLSLTLSMTHCSDPPTFFRLIAAALTLSLRTDKLNSRCREIANVSTVTRCKQALVCRCRLDRDMSLALPSYLDLPLLGTLHKSTYIRNAVMLWDVMRASMAAKAGRGLSNGQRPFRVSFAQGYIR